MEWSGRYLDKVALYPPLNHFNEGYVQVSEIHQLYYREFGNPDGVPVVLNHGGPGAGLSPRRVDLFDPSFYRIIMYDQRGAMRSKPFLSLDDNHTQALVKDLHTLKNHLNVKQWLVFGGSWGSTLSLAYAQHYPEDVLGMVIYGVTLAKPNMVKNLMVELQAIYPEHYQIFLEQFPDVEQANLLEHLYHRVMSSDDHVALEAARAFVQLDILCGQFYPDLKALSQIMQQDDIVLGVTRFFFHYMTNDFFLRENQLLDNMHLIEHLPVHIVHGRHDCICKPIDAYLVHQQLPKSTLSFVTDSNHQDIGSLGKVIMLKLEWFKYYLKKV